MQTDSGIRELVAETLEDIVKPEKILAVVFDKAVNCNLARTMITKKDGFTEVIH